MLNQITFLGIEKRFPGVVALARVSFGIKAGSCHALMGENGAGKSTLGKILAGIYHPDAGQIEIEGKVRHFRSPREARMAGVAIVHQEWTLCSNLTVAENISLSALPKKGLMLDENKLVEQALQFLREVGADCDPQQELGTLSCGQMQLIQIAAALATGARILVMDEPTSSLSLAEARRLEELIHCLLKRGTTIVYVSHRMDEIFRLCDTVTVLRDGQHVATLPISETDPDDLVRRMIGRTLEKHVPTHVKHAAGPECLRVEGLSSPNKFQDVNFRLCSGEVLGVAGLVGSGRSEVALAIFGIDSASTGKIFVESKPVKIRNPREALSVGVGLLGEDRKRQGLMPQMSCAENVTLSSLHCPGGRGAWGRFVHCLLCKRKGECLRLWDFIRLGAERRRVSEFFSQLRVRAASPEVAAVTLSGGNQQKLLLARLLARKCGVLILDEPTRGVDVGAKTEIHRLIEQLASEGYAILMISSELPEVLRLSNRVMVMRNRRLVGTVDRADATEETLMQLMAGRAPMSTPQLSN